VDTEWAMVVRRESVVARREATVGDMVEIRESDVVRREAMEEATDISRRMHRSKCLLQYHDLPYQTSYPYSLPSSLLDKNRILRLNARWLEVYKMNRKRIEKKVKVDVATKSKVNR
jgi:hypothetical protein